MNWFRRIVLAVVTIFVAVTLPSSAAALAHVYDAPAGASADVHELGALRATRPQLIDQRKESVSPLPPAQGTSTTRVAPVVATNTVGIPNVSDAKLKNYVDQLYKHANKPGTVGNGTTMDAIPGEIAAGSGQHIQKGEEIARGLRNWLRRNPNASYCDRLIAQSLHDELINALGYVPS